MKKIMGWLYKFFEVETDQKILGKSELNIPEDVFGEIKNGYQYIF